ncbi:hypothetical protein H696_05782 [Fonticula alba]|uniref:Splicing factor YJU2 n=1 Tax=Fonticula alba TaxID=691883 RepID=A0A058Z2C4_FONAL|nr:hypothetical protein H696_05782 [Fonticula alba]KCV67672.1 hypothetical protein H696_05782 [Fonticula alba]|eukprot:XP_009497856.1 hypothetical protein H696_05782 [Fonticula alba]
MSERKVINKHIPVDFDPALLPRVKRRADKQVKVRLESPFTWRCNSCSNYTYFGKRFNARKEEAEAALSYLGVRVFRFYIRCPSCSAEVMFRTDPANNDYVLEKGATRANESWRDGQRERIARAEQQDREAAEAAARGEAPKKEDSLAQIEQRMLDVQAEIERDHQLEDIRAGAALRARATPGAILSMLDGKHRAEEAREQEEEDRLVREAERRMAAARRVPSSVSSLASDDLGAWAPVVDVPAGPGAAAEAAPAGPGPTSAAGGAAPAPGPRVIARPKRQPTIAAIEEDDDGDRAGGDRLPPLGRSTRHASAASLLPAVADAGPAAVAPVSPASDAALSEARPSSAGPAAVPAVSAPVAAAPPAVASLSAPLVSGGQAPRSRPNGVGSARPRSGLLAGVVIKRRKTDA